jgi:hypothetical protein
MKKIQVLLLPFTAAAALMLSGCAPHYYPPPPPPGGPPPLVQMADQNGFESGLRDGARDVNQGTGYHPQADRKFHEAPGYDPTFGPRPVYVRNFRAAYLRGYDKAFYRR